MKQTKASDRLREARKSAGFASAAEAARRIGVSPITYTAHENGTRDYDRNACLNYAKKFHVSPAWLMFGTDAPVAGSFDESDIPVVDFTPGTAERTGKLLPEYEVIDRSVIKDFTVDTMRLPDVIVTKQLGSEREFLFAVEFKSSRRESSGRSTIRQGDFLLVTSKMHGPPLGEHYLVATGILPEVLAIELQARSDTGALLARAIPATGGGDEQIMPLNQFRILGQIVGVISQYAATIS